MSVSGCKVSLGYLSQIKIKKKKNFNGQPLLLITIILVIFFQVIGTFISNSGFEDVVFQSGICTSGSLNGVLTGSHYNRAWTVHSIVSEALERKLMQRFITESQIRVPESLIVVSSDPDQFTNVTISECTLESEQFITEYEAFKESGRKGKLGKTAHFWIIYLDLMKFQHMVHTSVQENNIDMRTDCWERFLPYYFALNMVNYARYGSFYLHMLKNIQSRYPGLKELLEHKGMSVQAQNRYPLRTAIDQCGEHDTSTVTPKHQVGLNPLQLTNLEFESGV